MSRLAGQCETLDVSDSFEMEGADSPHLSCSIVQSMINMVQCRMLLNVSSNDTLLHSCVMLFEIDGKFCWGGECFDCWCLHAHLSCSVGSLVLVIGSVHDGDRAETVFAKLSSVTTT